MSATTETSASSQEKWKSDLKRIWAAGMHHDVGIEQLLEWWPTRAEWEKFEVENTDRERQHAIIWKLKRHFFDEDEFEALLKRFNRKDRAARRKIFSMLTNESEREDCVTAISNYHYRNSGEIKTIRAKEIYQNPKTLTEDRRNLLSFAFSKLALKSGELDVEYTSGFEFLAKWMPMLNEQFEPEKTVANKRQKAASAASRPTLLRG